MTSIHEIFTTFAPEYLQRYASSMPKTHRKVIDAITACRTEACGIASTSAKAALSRASSFAPAAIATVLPANTIRPNSGCENRSSVNCRVTTSSLRLPSQNRRVLSCANTSAPVTPLCSRRLLMRSKNLPSIENTSVPISQASSAYSTPGDAPLQYHPHIHYIVCGGALGSADGSWHPSRIDFFLPVKALSKIFRAKFRDLMEQAKLLDRIPPDVWQIAWNVNCQAVASSDATLKYLAPYVFKVAISNSRIVSVQDRTVRFAIASPTVNDRESCPSMSWNSSAASCSMCCPLAL